MFISDQFVFVQLHKTGGMHIVKLLSRLAKGKRWGKHNPPSSKLLQSGRTFLGSVRNPWDWYVSLWGYGCDRRGAVYIKTRDQGLLRMLDLGWRTDRPRARQRLRDQKPRHPKAWRRVYADVNDPGCFREWLHMIHDEAYWEEYGEGYAYSPVNRHAGLMTYRYLKLFCGLVIDDAREESLSALAGVRAFESRHNYIDYFIRNEHLEDDLLRALDGIGVEIPEEERAKVFASKRTNTSTRKKGTTPYYDPATRTLIEEREQLIIERFGYPTPCNS